MYDIIDQIRYDHISISRVLFIMEQEFYKLKEDVDADIGLIEDCMHYLVDYADVVHHPKEDAMMDCIKDESDELRELVAEINMQHESIARMSGALYEKVQAAAQGEFIEKQGLVEEGLNFVRMQRAHIRLEEGSLLKRVRHLVSEEDIRKIDENYANFRDPHLSDSFEQEYGALYRSLLH